MTQYLRYLTTPIPDKPRKLPDLFKTTAEDDITLLSNGRPWSHKTPDILTSPWPSQKNPRRQRNFSHLLKLSACNYCAKFYDQVFNEIVCTMYKLDIYRYFLPDDNKLCNNDHIISTLQPWLYRNQRYVWRHVKNVSGIHEWICLARLWAMPALQLWLGLKCQLWCHCSACSSPSSGWPEIWPGHGHSGKWKYQHLWCHEHCTWSQQSAWEEHFHCQSGHPCNILPIPFNLPW